MSPEFRRKHRTGSLQRCEHTFWRVRAGRHIGSGWRKWA